jgi:benzoyl-CoA reductase/2-hydroxyglutaryl-CoA dehydratase subunit BcrC/BadD/HgdB
LSRERGALGLADRPLYTIMRTREYLPAERFAALGERVLATRGEGSPSGVPVIVSGMLPEPMAILDAISAAGGRVAADDWSCCGRRLYPAGSSLEPLRRMAESLLGAGPDATRGSSIAARADHLLRLVERTGAVAVIFHLVKFCEPELFYVPELGRALAEKGVRTVSLEVDVSEPWSHQLSTRIEALLETIR